MPGLQQRAIHQEVLIAQLRLYLWRRHHLVEEAAHDLVIEEALAVFCEGRGVPDRIIRAHAHKPAEQQVVVQLLQQKPLRTNPVERLQQRVKQQLLGRHRWPAFYGKEPTEGGNEPIKGLIGQFPDPPQRMADRDSLLD